MLDLNLGIQFNSVKQPVKSNSVGSAYVSRCRTSAFDDYFNHCFVVFLQQCRASHQIEKSSRSTSHNRHCLIQDYRAELESCFGCGCACSIGVSRNKFPGTLPLDFFNWLGKNGKLQ